jgi:hypothetical protein
MTARSTCLMVGILAILLNPSSAQAISIQLCAAPCTASIAPSDNNGVIKNIGPGPTAAANEAQWVDPGLRRILYRSQQRWSYSARALSARV